MERVLNIALGEVGYLEKASNKSLYSKTANAGKANFTKYAADMSEYHAGIYANGYPWCDTFVDWCMVKAYDEDAKKLIYGWSAYTPTSAGYFKNNFRWFLTGEKGDIVFFKDSTGTICHTGIVYMTDSTCIYTVEGNTSFQSGVVANGGAVAKKSYRRDYSRIAGYGRPDYSIVNPIPKEDIELNKIYNTVAECPFWAQPYVQLACDRGYIKGISDGSLNLDDTKIWCLVVMLRCQDIMK